MLTVAEAKLRALHHHADTRKGDAANPLQIHPLLTDRNLKSLPSAAEMGAISRNVCRAPHPGKRDLESSFLYYYSQAASDSYAPLIPNAGIPPLSASCLPGGAAVIDHLIALMESHRSYVCGGSFLPWISGTLDLCSKFRQPAGCLPVVRTLVFGRSSEAQISSFVQEFNDKIASSESFAQGFIPHSFYSFDVECVTAFPPTTFKVADGTSNILEIAAPKLPARIHFGFHDSRFEVVIPWEDRYMNHNLQACYTLRMPSMRPTTLWHTLFSRLRGTAVGIGLKDDMKQLSDFLAHFFSDSLGLIKLNTAELEILLALAGYNSTRTNISALNFLFTGGVILKPWQIRCGLGRWGSTQPLPPALNVYLQSEALGVLNTALIATCCILVHWFVTPGIAAIVSRKTPQKFIPWFTRFLSTVLRGASIPAANQFSNSVDRVGSPREMILKIVYSADQPPIFLPVDLAKCIPPWRNVTGGGCPSDQLAFDHILRNLWPILRRTGVPLHLRWESNIKVVTGFLSGKPTPSARSWSSSRLGCQPDSATVDLPVLVPCSTGPNLAPLRPQLVAFKSSLPEGHALRGLSASQLFLSYAWQNPEETFGLFQSQMGGSRKHFSNQEFDLLRPLVAAYFPEVGVSSSPASYLRFRQARTFRNEQARVRQIHDLMRSTTDPVTRRRLRKKMRNAFWNKYRANRELDLSVQASYRTQTCCSDVTETISTVTAEVEDLTIAPPWVPDAIADMSSSDELEVDTPAWDDL